MLLNFNMKLFSIMAWHVANFGLVKYSIEMKAFLSKSYLRLIDKFFQRAIFSTTFCDFDGIS